FSATSGSRLFISIRIGASVSQDFAVSVLPCAARITRALSMRVMSKFLAAMVSVAGRSRAGDTPPYPCVKRIEPNSVDELGRPLDIPDREVAGFTGVQTSGLVEQAER